MKFKAAFLLKKDNYRFHENFSWAELWLLARIY